MQVGQGDKTSLPVHISLSFLMRSYSYDKHMYEGVVWSKHN